MIFGIVKEAKQNLLISYILSNYDLHLNLPTGVVRRRNNLIVFHKPIHYMRSLNLNYANDT